MPLFDMDADTWRALDTLLDEAIDLDPNDIEPWLARLPPSAEPFKPQLRSLLQHGPKEGNDSLRTLPKLTGPHPTSVRPPQSPGDRVGPYCLTKMLGRGGMGTVWLAERTDGLVQRPIALKLPESALASSVLIERLSREREILAALEHPNIARLYDAGISEEGQPYLALEYVEGRTLDAYLEATDPNINERLSLFVQIAEAVAYAHSRLIVHRDLKPSNILVTPAGDVKLLDFGIAKLLEDGKAETTALTLEAGRAFTLSYASPEQVSDAPLGVGSDIYSLGVILYELLSLRRPYSLKRDSRGELEEAILYGEILRPSEVVERPGWKRVLRGDLDTIVLKTLKKRPDDRYLTVNALIDDVGRLRAGLPVRAQPDSLGYRIRKFVQRNALAVFACTLGLSTILSTAGLAIWQARVATLEKERAEEVKAFVMSIFQRANPWEHGGQQTVLDVLDNAKVKIDEGFEGRPNLQAELLGLVGSSLREFGEFGRALEVFDEAITKAEVTLSRDDPLLLDLRGKRLILYWYLERVEDMERETNELLAVAQGSRDVPMDNVITALRFSSMTKIKKEQYGEAAATAARGKALALQHFDRSHALFLQLAKLEALARLLAGDAERAIAVAKEAIDVARSGSTPDNMQGLDAESLYGRALLKDGQLKKGREVLERVVTGVQSKLRRDHPLAGVVLGILSREHLRVGRVGTATAAAAASVSILAKYKDPKSPGLARTRILLGTSLVAARRFKEAVAILEQGRRPLVERFGVAHPQVIEADVERALAIARLGESARAAALVRSAIERRTNPKGFDRARHVEGVLLRLAEDFESALAAQVDAERSLDGAKSRDLELPRIRIEVGLTQLGLRRHREAIASLKDGIELAERHHEAESPITADAHLGLAAALSATGQDTAGRMHREAAASFWHSFRPSASSSAD